MEEIREKNLNLITNNEHYLQKYLKYIDVSEKTAKEYYSGIKSFFNYCFQNNIQNVQREDVIAYRELLKEQGKEAATINLYLSSVKSFFKWLNYDGIYKDITQNIKSVSVENTHKREPLTIEQIKKVLNLCSNVREEIIIELAVTTGIRCNELCNIRMQDFVIRGDKVCLYVLGKARQGMRTDYVVVSEKLYNKIQDYVNKNNITEYLFISTSNNSKNKPISTRSIRKIVNKIYDNAGLIGKEYVFHSLRHSFCNINLENGVSLAEVSQAMRHASVTTTMRYVKDIETKNNKCFDNVSNLIM